MKLIKLVRAIPEHTMFKEYWTWSSFTTMILFYICLLTIRKYILQILHFNVNSTINQNLLKITIFSFKFTVFTFLIPTILALYNVHSPNCTFRHSFFYIDLVANNFFNTVNTNLQHLAQTIIDYVQQLLSFKNTLTNAYLRSSIFKNNQNFLFWQLPKSF